MSIDLSEFHGVFFEECFEGLDIMESGLLNLDNGTDMEEINTIFRAAHSIKGGGASFGFMEIAGFTHIMETLLDEMRDGRREVSRDGVDLLLKSVDILRCMVTAAQEDDETDQQQVNDIKQQLENMLAGTETETPADNTSTDTVKEHTTANNNFERAEAIITGWKIHFKPHADTLKNGNEPARILCELQALGELQVVADISQIPDLNKIHSDTCYMAWDLELRGEIKKEEIEELFNWVADESELEITALEDNSNTSDIKTENVTTVEENKSTKTAEIESVAQEIEKPKAEKTDVEKSPKAKTSANKESSSIRVSISKIDELINMVGELVITQSMLSQTGSQIAGGNHAIQEKLQEGISQLERNTRELQESVLQIRMLPISFSFSRFPRLVRDLSGKMGKKIELKMVGENTEVDKTVLEKIGDPLVHLVRNSLDHGIETPEIRTAAGKPEVGTLELQAYHEGGDIIIKVIDDGAGLNRERIKIKAVEKGLVNEGEEISDDKIYNMIFQAGFSTAEQVTDVSGRGVGMDVVRRNIRDLGGNVSITSNDGAGSTVTIRLPLTLAILDGQLASIGDETYIISLVSIVESLQMQSEKISSITGQSEFYSLRDEYIPIIRVNQLFGMSKGHAELNNGLLIVVEADGQQVGLFVDELLGQQQVVIKSLETNFRQIQGISGATILGDGTVALIIDVPGLINRHFEDCNRRNVILTAVA
jgi:two-component system chemotaxis sensor kinase CheA